MAVAPYLTDESLESYILSLFGSVNQSAGEINDAINDLESKYHGITTQDKIDILEEMRSTSAADILTYADYLAKLNDDLNYVVVASPSNIEEYKDLFDSIIVLK